MVYVKLPELETGHYPTEPQDIESTHDTFALAHLSDPHFFAGDRASLRELLNKRIYGYVSWRLHRRLGHHDEVIEALVKDLHANRLDHIAVTGDLTHLGLAEEYARAAQLLRCLGAASQVTVIPGNHDAYVSGAQEQACAHWAAYMTSDARESRAAEAGASAPVFPSLRICGRVAVIGLSTALPCSPFLAVGRVGKTQLQTLEKILIETGRQQMFRIILIHHPPVSGVVSWRKRLTDAPAFRSVLARCGAELILHGHAHRFSLTRLQTPAGSIPVVGVSSASAISRDLQCRARYHIFRLTPTAHGWEILFSARGYVPAHRRFAAVDRQHWALPRAGD